MKEIKPVCVVLFRFVLFRSVLYIVLYFIRTGTTTTATAIYIGYK